ncbi:hypothetical protein PspLS_03577 [Pyricularia sp. CBS 133598]|nr:hypothetical protein PspLS_03577 [Pyricularia sp. CBS 133598]
MPPKFTANPQKPSRYRAGKPTQPESSSESDSDDEQPREKAAKKASEPVAAVRKPTGAGKIISTGSANKPVVPSAKPPTGVDAAARARAEAERKAKEDGFVTESEESGSGESGEDDSDDESGSSSSEDEAPRRRLMMRPKFIPKSQRNAAQDTSAGGEKPDEEADAAARQAALDAAIEEQVRKDAAAKAAGRKHWEDDSDAEPGSDFVDDTDDIDPEAEYAAWKVRELKRLKREREAIEEREREVQEKERRMALTEEERRAEDEAKIAKQREEQANRGKMGYMQKYFHKGAFFADDAAREGLNKRDLAGVRFQDDVKNRELLPQALQMRDMTKLGKKGATRYKDLRSEDTGRWGDGGGKDRYGRGLGDRFDGDERFRPDNDRGGGYGPDGAKGANAIPLGERKEDNLRDRYQESRRDDSRGRDRRSYRTLSRSRSPRRQDRRDYDRDRCTSRSPRRDRRDYSIERRKRSTSRGGRDGDHGDKRRRIDTR